MRFLVSVSVGPVQEFIAAARSTADLFAGSELLTRVVGAAAEVFGGPGVTRVFPVSAKAGGANKILAVVDTGQGAGHPESLVVLAREAAHAALQDEWRGVQDRLERAGAWKYVNSERALEQLRDFLEVYAAWVPLSGESSGYSAARARVERLLAGRKALRDFLPVEDDDAGVPKSPLDPSRASVVPDPSKLSGEPLNLKGTEFLDAVSVLKRVRGARLRDQADERRVLSTRELAQRAVKPGFLSLKDDLEPSFPYFAVLVADGDRMGQLLSQRDDVAAHQRVSAQLDAFARRARQVVREHDGQPVYSGGDDVLALLPVTTAVACARDLAVAFAQELGVPFGVPDPDTSLSVGVAIVHHMEPLSVALQRGRAAEKDAKVDRNALSVALHTRGGSPLKVRQVWSAFTLDRWLALARSGLITRGLPYELRELAREWPAGLRDARALQGEVQRIVRHKRRQDGRAGHAEFRHDLEDHADGADLLGVGTAQELKELADVMILSRFMTGEALPGGEA